MSDELRVTLNGKPLGRWSSSEAAAGRRDDAERAKLRDDRLREADKLGEDPLAKFARVWERAS